MSTNLAHETECEDRSEALLRFLEAVIAADRGPIGRSGKIAIGIAKPTGPSWLVIELDPRRASTTRTDTPGQPDAALILGMREAVALVDCEQLPAEPLAIQTGDESLFRYFIRRYLATASLWKAFARHQERAARSVKGENR